MTLFCQLITIFFVILLGIFCYKKELFNKTQIDGFEILLFKVIMPSYLFAASYKNDLSTLLNFDYISLSATPLTNKLVITKDIKYTTLEL